ncbi:MAG: hypothetical protein JSS61_03825 [Verrucomicrobia bacterium]|nr:hypothetical protein [Verrucomicrobiota bacterium]
MKFALLCLFFLTQLLHAFHDEELQAVWDAIPDINEPRIEDYQRLEDYLKNGRRSYLDVLRKSPCARLNRMTQFQFLGPNGEMPIFEKHQFGTSSRSRCILLYASANGIYPQKARLLLSEIAECGYEGDVLLRIGGYPNTGHGGLRFCHIPYAFKAQFMLEAKLLGYDEVLWLDLAIHPWGNFDTPFLIIEETGYLLTEVGTLDGNAPLHLESAAASLSLPRGRYIEVPHLSSGILGLNMRNLEACALLDKWIRALERVYPAISWFPEELSLSVLAWRQGWEPSCCFGNLVCNEVEREDLEERPLVEFWLDTVR